VALENGSGCYDNGCQDTTTTGTMPATEGMIVAGGAFASSGACRVGLYDCRRFQVLPQAAAAAIQQPDFRSL
jgi:hypothetical protein